MPDKILIVSQSHLCRNPRVFKEATALSASGYGVTILTAIYNENLLKEDLELLAGTGITYEFYSDLTQQNVKTFTDKMVRRTAAALQAKFGINSKYSLAYGAGRLLKRCLAFKANLYIMHQELPAYTGGQMLLLGHKVAFDLEDWYAEDLLPIARNSRPLKLLRKAEWIALNKGTLCYTTSKALAGKLHETYNGNMPEVIYNVFPLQNDLHVKAITDRALKLFWFSQTIGPGRGIERFIKLLNDIRPTLELHLLGSITDDYRQQLTGLMPRQHRLHFHVLVKDDALAKKISGFDIGLALEMDEPQSRNLTITNKFFQYLQAGLPVIATATKGQQEAFEKFSPGLMLPQDPAKNDIEKLNAWINDKAALQLAQEAAKRAAQFYNWERESVKLLGYIKNILQ